MFSLRYCKDIVNWLFLVLRPCLATYSQIILSSSRKLLSLLQVKNQLHPPYFCGDIAKICKLILGALGMPGYITQNDSLILQKTSMFICMQKIILIIHFFLTILHFKESCNLIDWQHSGP